MAVHREQQQQLVSDALSPFVSNGERESVEPYNPPPEH
jgi:hypothetical protein